MTAQGWIAACARREAAAKFNVVQTKVLADCDRAAASLGAARVKLSTASGLISTLTSSRAPVTVAVTAEATAAGALYSDAAGRFAVLAKTTRNATIGFVVLGYALYWIRREGGAVISNKASFLWDKFPKFVLGFLVISGLATAGAFAPSEAADLANLSRWAFLLTFAGIGLRTNIGGLVRQGWRPLAVGVVGEVAIAVVTLAMVLSVARAWNF